MGRPAVCCFELFGRIENDNAEKLLKSLITSRAVEKTDRILKVYQSAYKQKKGVGNKDPVVTALRILIVGSGVNCRAKITVNVCRGKRSQVWPVQLEDDHSQQKFINPTSDRVRLPKLGQCSIENTCDYPLKFELELFENFLRVSQFDSWGRGAGVTPLKCLVGVCWALGLQNRTLSYFRPKYVIFRHQWAPKLNSTQLNSKRQNETKTPKLN